jgi:hypothetical protein
MPRLMGVWNFGSSGPIPAPTASGLYLLIAPDLLSNVWIGLVVLIAAVILTGVLVLAARFAPIGRKAR